MASRPSLERMRGRKTVRGPVLAMAENGLSPVPYMLSDGNSLTFSGGIDRSAVTVIGAVSLPGGYPITGEYGEVGARVTVVFSDGESEEFLMRNGIEFTTAHTTLASSRISPRAEKAKRFAEFNYDKNLDNYILNSLELDLSSKKKVTEVRFESVGDKYALLIYGVFA